MLLRTRNVAQDPTQRVIIGVLEVLSDPKADPTQFDIESPCAPHTHSNPHCVVRPPQRSGRSTPLQACWQGRFFFQPAAVRKALYVSSLVSVTVRGLPPST